MREQCNDFIGSERGEEIAETAGDVVGKVAYLSFLTRGCEFDRVFEEEDYILHAPSQAVLWEFAQIKVIGRLELIDTLAFLPKKLAVLEQDQPVNRSKQLHRP